MRRNRELYQDLEAKFGSAASEPRRQFIEGLRAVAAFYETHHDAYYDGMGVSLNMYVPQSATLTGFCSAAQALGCSIASSPRGMVAASRQFSPKVSVQLFARTRRNEL